MKKHVCIYGAKEKLIVPHTTDLATYDIIITGYGVDGIPAIKELNPKLKWLFYRPLIGVLSGYVDFKSLQDQWFVRCETTGEKVIHVHGWYLMDVTSAGFRKHLAGFISEKLTNPLYDGVFLDCALENINPQRYRTELTKAVPNLSSFSQLYVKASELVLRKIEAFKIINPGGPVRTDCIPYCDGQMIEGVIHAEWEYDSLTCDKKRWDAETAKLKLLTDAGKYALLNSGSLVGENNAVHRAMAETFYRIYGNEKTTFSFNFPF